MAVTAPNCKICEHSHWSTQPHQFSGKKSSAKSAAAERVKQIESRPVKLGSKGKSKKAKLTKKPQRSAK